MSDNTPGTIARTKVKLSWIEQVDRSMHSHAIRLVLFALVANTIMAQAFFNSAGRILAFGGVNLTGLYLNVSSIFSTFAFSLFEIAMLWARQEVLSLDESIKKQIGAKDWLRRNLVTLIVISLINFYSLTVFNAAIWPDIHVPGIPEPPAPWKFYVHAGFYTVILYLAGIVGERVRSEQELTMTMARKHTQQALAAHDAQVQQQIREMTARGEPLAPLAAATSSPETAQLIALQSLVLAGKVDVMEAARMNVAATGGDTRLLDRIGSRRDAPTTVAPMSALPTGDVLDPDLILPTASLPVENDADLEVADEMPMQRYNGRRITARLEATRMSTTNRPSRSASSRSSTPSVTPAFEPLVRAYQALFLNRETPYARQRDDGSYRWLFQPCDQKVLAAHLAGDMTIAIASLDVASRCRWVCLDSDSEDGLAQFLQVRTHLADHGLPGILEASRRGGHLWLFFAEPVEASIAREVVLRLLDALRSDELSLDRLDVYPDTRRVGALGHAVRLPLGVHRRSGKRYPFIDELGKPLPLAKLSDALNYLAEAPRITTEHLAVLQAQLTPAGEGLAAPRDEVLPESPGTAVTSTRSGIMRWVDAHVSPLDLLEELAPSSEMQRAGQGWLGWCPFHDDRAAQEDGSPGTPSIYLVHNTTHGWSWRCLSSNCAQHEGHMRHTFRLFQELLGLDAKEAIRAALERWPDETREPSDPHD